MNRGGGSFAPALFSFGAQGGRNGNHGKRSGALRLLSGWGLASVRSHPGNSGGAMMRKAVTVLMVLVMVGVAYGQAGVECLQINPAQVLFDASNNAYVAIKAALSNPQYYNAARWVAATVVTAGSAAITGVAITTGALAIAASGVGMGILAAWCIDQALEYYIGEDGSIKVYDPENNIVNPPPGIREGYLDDAEESGYWVAEGSIGMGPWSSIYANKYYNYVTAIAPPAEGFNWCWNAGYQCSSGGVNLGWDTTYWNHREKCFYNTPPGKNTNLVCMYATHAESRAAIQALENMMSPPTPVPFTPAEMAQRIADALGVNEPEETQEKTRDLVVASVGAVAGPYNAGKEEGYPPVGFPNFGPTAAGTVNGAMAAGVSQTIVDEMEAEDTLANALPGNVDTTLPTGKADPQAATNVKAGVLSAERELDKEREQQFDDLSGSATPPPSEPEPPEKKSLTSILNWFKDAAWSLPIISWLTGAELEISGATSTLDLPTPAQWNAGAIQLDFADYEGVVSFMGNGLLAFVGLYWTLWLFRGRNDG